MRGPHGRKLLEEEVLQIRSRLKAGEKIDDLAKIYEVSRSAISAIRTGTNWKHLGGKIRVHYRHGRAKLKPDDVRRIRQLVAEGKRQKDAAAEFKVSAATISQIASGEIWHWVR